MDAPRSLPRVARSEPVPDDVRRLLRGLPEWFGIDEAIDSYVEAARSLTTYVVREGSDGIAGTEPGEDADGASYGDGKIIGVCLVERHSEYSSEIHLLAVEREHHRRGIGQALMRRAERDLELDGKEFLQVKTLGASHPSPEYAATRHFYEALGYRALQELPADELWPGNPCLIMVKALRPHSPAA